MSVLTPGFKLGKLEVTDCDISETVNYTFLDFSFPGPILLSLSSMSPHPRTILDETSCDRVRGAHSYLWDLRERHPSKMSLRSRRILDDVVPFRLNPPLDDFYTHN
jgi:hypothetical protein